MGRLSIHFSDATVDTISQFCFTKLESDDVGLISTIKALWHMLYMVYVIVYCTVHLSSVQYGQRAQLSDWLYLMIMDVVGW